MLNQDDDLPIGPQAPTRRRRALGDAGHPARAFRVSGIVRIDRRTKHLVQRLGRGEIAVICHRDLDGPCAQSLVSRGVAAVVNAEASISGKYPNLGPEILLEAGVPILDEAGPAVLDELTEGDRVELVGHRLYLDGAMIAEGTLLTSEEVRQRLRLAKRNLNDELRRFVQNTMSYIGAEQGLLFEPSQLPALRAQFEGHHALVVVRGEGCTEDLQAVRSYVREVRPVLVGVDGGADVLLEAGFKPDIIIGDMDSVSDRALRSGAELVVHAYAHDGQAPGLERLERLGLECTVFRSLGTSEDVAMLMAFEKGAELIVAVGSHSSLVDFLEKARGGMASTFLTRLKIGSSLVDAKGVSRLYRSGPPPAYMAVLAAVALTTIVMLCSWAPQVRGYLHLLALKVRLLIQHLVGF
jgi:uncharacterized membrane-anchored protein